MTADREWDLAIRGVVEHSIRRSIGFGAADTTVEPDAPTILVAEDVWAELGEPRRIRVSVQALGPRPTG